MSLTWLHKKKKKKKSWLYTLHGTSGVAIKIISCVIENASNIPPLQDQVCWITVLLQFRKRVISFFMPQILANFHVNRIQWYLMSREWQEYTRWWTLSSEALLRTFHSRNHPYHCSVLFSQHEKKQVKFRNMPMMII